MASTATSSVLTRAALKACVRATRSLIAHGIETDATIKMAAKQLAPMMAATTATRSSVIGLAFRYHIQLQKQQQQVGSEMAFVTSTTGINTALASLLEVRCNLF